MFCLLLLLRQPDRTPPVFNDMWLFDLFLQSHLASSPDCCPSRCYLPLHDEFCRESPFYFCPILNVGWIYSERLEVVSLKHQPEYLVEQIDLPVDHLLVDARGS